MILVKNNGNLLKALFTFGLCVYVCGCVCVYSELLVIYRSLIIRHSEKTVSVKMQSHGDLSHVDRQLQQLQKSIIVNRGAKIRTGCTGYCTHN